MWTEPRRKVFGIPLRKEVQRTPDGALVVRGYFTSDRKDEVGDIITRAATEKAIPRFRQWSNVRYMHLPRPVAKVTRIGVQDGLEWNEVEIKVIDPQTIFEVENGLLTALSVGILVNFDDVEFLEDGGWVINQYTLAEISLVDHPANYDARLKDVSVDQNLRMLAREYGMNALAHSMQALLEREVSMENENKDIPVEDEASQSDPQSPLDDVPLPEAQPTEESEETAEPVEAELPTESDTFEDQAEQGSPDLTELLGELLEEVHSLTGAIAKMHEALAVLVQVKQISDAYETAAEAESDAVPVNRKGALPETILPDEKSASQRESQPVTDLRQALLKYFAQRQR